MVAVLCVFLLATVPVNIILQRGGVSVVADTINPFEPRVPDSHTDKLGDSLVHWKRLASEFSLLSTIQIPRCLFVKNRTPVHYQLHGYSDTSERAYAAVIYLRIQYSEGDTVDVSLIASLGLIRFSKSCQTYIP